MRGRERAVRGAVAAVALCGFCSIAIGQQDPRIGVSFDNAMVQKANGDTLKLDQVTLSRDELMTFAAYDLIYTNNTTNPLARLYFSATVTNTNGTDNGKFNQVYLGTSTGFDCTGFGTASLSCTSNISLSAGSTQKVTIVVQAPTTGTQLNVNILAGGYEGKSQTGQGCCAQPASASTQLVDSTTDATFTYTLNAVTFVKGETGGRIFTGKQAVAMTADPFTTDVNAAAFTSAPYDIGLVQEAAVPAMAGSNCKSGNRFKSCGASSVSLPNVHYTGLPDPLTPLNICGRAEGLSVFLGIDSSLVKGNPTPDLSLIRVQYTPDPTVEEPNPETRDVYDCVQNVGLPCVCGRKQFVKGSEGWTKDKANDIQLWMKGIGNGRFNFF
jgi:hypothetical protein